MAVGLWETALVLHARRSGAAMDDFLMLGRQSLALDPGIIDHLNRTYGVALKMDDWSGQEWADPLFRSIGAREVFALDYSDYEGAQFTHDMNRPWPGGEPPRQFDVVFDGGTLEHVFNLPQALLNAMSLVRTGGCFLGVSPADGWLGHGFHQLQPELFFRFFVESNGFRLRGVWLAEFGPPASRSRLFRVADPALAGCRNLVPGRRPLVLLVHAEKIAETPAEPSWPGQSNYTSMWREGGGGDGEGPGGSTPFLRRTLSCCLPRGIAHRLRLWLIARKHARLARAGWVRVDSLHSEGNS